MSQGWYLTLLSSALCISGCLVVFLDDLYYLLFPKFITKRFPFRLKENYKFMNASLAFSSGCLLFTALYRLLPEALAYLKDTDADASTKMILSSTRQLHIKMFMAYIGGIILSLTFNAILHIATSESVFHCSEHDHDSAGANNATHQDRESLPPQTTEVHEESPLLPTLLRKKSLFHLLSAQRNDECIEGECKGYSSAELCLFHGDKNASLHHCDIPAISPKLLPQDENGAIHIDLTETLPVKADSKHTHGHGDIEASADQNHDHNHSHDHGNDHSHSVHNDHSHHHDHHHHVNSAFSKLFLIGIQTILAITLHKFPEGFITYITSETDPQLGVLIFISLLFHNFTEGFLMCLPLYYLFASSLKMRLAKLKAVTISAFLGGISQPLGALGAILFLRLNNITPGDGNLDVDKLNHILGLTLAVTSGFLTVIGLSMYGSAVAFSGGSLHLIMVWCLVGMSVIGVSSVISVE